MKFRYEVEPDSLSNAGMASGKVKKALKQLGVSPEIIRKVSIAMYEAEINMVIHANGGVIDGEISSDRIYICLQDKGPGIPNIEQAMQVGYSTASHKAREMGFGAGMGLPNIKRNSSEFNISTEIGKGTKVEIIVNFN